MSESDGSAQGWRRWATAGWLWLPGVTVIGLVVIARLPGLFQGLELKTLDVFLRLRPAEPQDDRILIVGIDEADIQRVGTYPIPDGVLAELLQTLAESEPHTIGIDIYRDLPVQPGHQTLTQTLTTSPEIFAIEKIFGTPISPPSALPLSQVGFIDLPLDSDGFVRRAYLGTLPSLEARDPDRFRFSLPLQLAAEYLKEEGLLLENGLRNPNSMRFGDTELVQVQPSSGGYVGVDASGIQMLINPRSGPVPFERVSMTDVLEGRVKADQIRDRIVLIGITSLSFKDLVNSAAVNADNPGLFYGVEMHAHITSAIISAVLDDRPLLRVWGDGWEYAWIVLWGSVGMGLVRVVSRPARYLLLVALGGLGLTATSLLLLWLGGWWLPVVPTLAVFGLNGLVLPGFYFYDQTLRSRIEERQRVIESTYDDIHNGPLQTLALLLQEKDQLDPAVGTRLETLNTELRTIYTRLLQESLPEADQLQLSAEKVIDLRAPLHEVLYQVYTETLKRDFPGFDSIKFQVVKFEPLQAAGLASDERRSLCRFLEEALCNVGKHAVTPKRLTVLCLTQAQENLIRIEDNGRLDPVPTEDQRQGRGTQQAHGLARRLRGRFDRGFSATGTYCELRWPCR